MNVFVRILGFQKKELSCDQVCHVVIDWSSHKDDVIFQESRIDVVRALASIGLFDHHWYQCQCSSPHAYISIAIDEIKRLILAQMLLKTLNPILLFELGS